MRFALCLFLGVLFLGCNQSPQDSSENAAPDAGQSQNESKQEKTSTGSSEDIAGEWQISHGKNGQFKHDVSLEALGDKRYRLKPSATAFKGVYELDGDLLRVVDQNPGYPDLVWERKSSDAFEMIEGNYIGGVMQR